MGVYSQWSRVGICGSKITKRKYQYRRGELWLKKTGQDFCRWQAINITWGMVWSEEFDQIHRWSDIQGVGFSLHWPCKILARWTGSSQKRAQMRLTKIWLRRKFLWRAKTMRKQFTKPKFSSRNITDPEVKRGWGQSLCMHTEWFVAFPLYVVPTVCPEARGMGNLEKSTGLSTVVTYS